jgi:hypothetical protein
LRTKPLGAVRRETVALESKGLHNGIKAWRLKIACRCRPEETVTNVIEKTSHLLALYYSGSNVGVTKLRRTTTSRRADETVIDVIGQRGRLLVMEYINKTVSVRNLPR